jgi:hypothetical protein
MTETSDAARAALRARYRSAAEALERVQLEDLAALSDEDALTRTRSLRLFATQPTPSRESSGLVEQQAVLHRRRRT